MDKTVYLNVAAIRREALAQLAAPLPQQAVEGGKSWRARNEQLDPAVGLAAVQEDPEEGSDACCAEELLPASAGLQGRTCSLPLPQMHSSDVRCRSSENIGEAQAPRAAEGLSWRQKLLARLGTSHSSSHPDTPHRQRHFICDGSTAAIPESNSVSADHVLLKNASTSRLMHGGHDPHQHGSTIPGYSPCAGGDGESHRHNRHHHHHHDHHQRHPHPHQQHYQQKHQQKHRQAQQHMPMAPAASRSSPVPAAGAAAAAESGAVSPRGGCHLVPLLSAADVQLAMQALQSAAWIHDYVWNSVDPATCGASPRTSSAGGGGSGGGGGGGSSRSSTRRREALAAIATPVYREALAAVSRIQHPALHSLVDQAVAFYVDPALGEPEDVLRIILELLTACGSMPAAATPPPPSARAAAPAPQSRSLSGGGGGGSGKDRLGPAVAAVGAAAVAAGRVSESGSSVVTVPSCRSLGGARRISSSCRASPLATEAAPRSCTALGAGLRRETCGAASGGAEGRAVSSASAVGEAAGGGIRGFGLRRKVAERFLSRSDGSSSSSSSSSTTSEAALSMGSSLGSLGVCTNGSVATAGGGDAAMAAAALHSCGSGVALHSASEGAPPGPNSGNDNLQSDLVVIDASYTAASAPTSAVIPAAAGAASYTSAASPTCVPAGGNADGSGHSSSRRAASLQGSEHITIPRGSSGGGNGGGVCASGGAARALRTLSLHGLRDVFRSHHNSPARENSSVGSGSSRSEVRGFPARAAMASDDSGGKGPASDHHHHHYHRLLSLFKKESGTAAHYAGQLGLIENGCQGFYSGSQWL